jgi:hypothetical protein
VGAVREEPGARLAPPDAPVPGVPGPTAAAPGAPTPARAPGKLVGPGGFQLD